MKESDPPLEIVTIPREKATFAMDEHGRWINPSGRLAKRSIIRYLNAAIAEDEAGFFVTQQIDGRIEKVYFPYVKTALFAIDLNLKTIPVGLKLNNGRLIDLNPEKIYVEDDQLYMKWGFSCIRFTERCLLKLTGVMDPSEEKLVLTIGDQRYPIPSIALQVD